MTRPEPAAGKAAGPAAPLPLTAVIPALDAAESIAVTLASLGAAAAIVVDGGSADRTPEIARALGAQVVATERGRGRQLAAGAAAAATPWLLFLHADTTLEPGWQDEVAAFIAAPANRERAAAFRFRLADAGPAPRWVEAMVGIRGRLFALPYGDQGLLIHRALYDAIGGFRPLPLMEDVDMVRRLGRGRLVLLRSRATTSAARYRRDGYLARSARNLACLLMYFLGIDADVIRRVYGP